MKLAVVFAPDHVYRHGFGNNRDQWPPLIREVLRLTQTVFHVKQKPEEKNARDGTVQREDATD